MSVQCRDRYIRIFTFRTGKLLKKYDERLQVFEDEQKADNPLYKLDGLDFGLRMAVERDYDKASKSAASPGLIPISNVIFDESGHFILYPTLLGIKMVNIRTNQLVRMLGKVENTERFCDISLFQGRPKEIGGSVMAEMGAGLIQVFHSCHASSFIHVSISTNMVDRLMQVHKQLRKKIPWY
jgi:hypothetical protein